MANARKGFIVAVAVLFFLVSGALAATGTRQRTPRKTPAPEKAAPKLQNLNAVVTECSRTFGSAVKTAGLDTMLESEKVYTVFVPDQAAFDKLPAGEFDKLLKQKDRLAAMVKGHVVAGRFTETELKKMKEVKTLEGTTLAIEVKDGTVMVGGAKLVKANQRASNGEVQVIDAVFMPKEKAAAPEKAGEKVEKPEKAPSGK